MKEIERKFLLNSVPTEIALGTPKELICQGYLSVSEGGNEVRLRKRGSRYTLTVKSAGQLVRDEVELPLDPAAFEQLWPLAGHARIEKSRSTVRYMEHSIEIDIYCGRLLGLSIAEVEFDSVESSQNFVPPGWFGVEVTSDVRYKNRNLASAQEPPQLVD